MNIFDQNKDQRSTFSKISIAIVNSHQNSILFFFFSFEKYALKNITKHFYSKHHDTENGICFRQYNQVHLDTVAAP